MYITAQMNFTPTNSYYFAVGSAVSSIAICAALATFYKLRLCSIKITLHVNLFICLLLSCTSWLFWFFFVINNNRILITNHLWCIGLHNFNLYCFIAGHTWMFLEAVYLFRILKMTVNIHEERMMKFFYLIGWGAPLIIVGSYITVRVLYEQTDNCWVDVRGNLILFLTVPICLTITVSTILSGFILYMQNRRGHPRLNELTIGCLCNSVKSLISLITLFGLYFWLVPLQPANDSIFIIPYEILAIVFLSLHGLWLSFFLCFCHKEVISAIIAQWRRRQQLIQDNRDIDLAIVASQIAMEATRRARSHENEEAMI